MASGSAERVYHSTLAANTEDEVTLGRNYRRVEIVNRDGAAEIYVRVDEGHPTVAGGECEVLPAAIGAVIVESNRSGDTIVRLISSGAPTYSVVGVEE